MASIITTNKFPGGLAARHYHMHIIDLRLLVIGHWQRVFSMKLSKHTSRRRLIGRWQLAALRKTLIGILSSSYPLSKTVHRLCMLRSLLYLDD